MFRIRRSSRAFIPVNILPVPGEILRTAEAWEQAAHEERKAARRCRARGVCNPLGIGPWLASAARRFELAQHCEQHARRRAALATEELKDKFLGRP